MKMSSGARSPYSISLVFPAYNEEENIERTVREAAEVGSRLFRDHEIVVVDDGSRDGTSRVLEALRGEFPELRPVRHERNAGYGAALVTGFRAASKDLVFFSDSDGQFDLSEIARLLPHIESHDIVTGYRENRSDPLHRRMNALGWNSVVRLVLRTGVRDINCAFKLMRRGVFDLIELKSRGALVNAELLGKARRLRMSVREVPVTHKPRRHGVQTGAKPAVVLRAFAELLRLQSEIRAATNGRPAAAKLRGPVVPLGAAAAAPRLTEAGAGAGIG